MSNVSKEAKEADIHAEHTDNWEYEDAPGLHWKTILVLLSTALAYFAQLYSIVAAGALAIPIAAVIGGSDKKSWLSEAILIMTVVLGPPVASASDLFGRKWFVILGSTFGFAGAVVTGRAKTMNVAIVGQALVGISFATQPLLHAIPSEIVHRRYRPAAQAVINVAAAVGAIVSLTVGGRFVDNNTGGQGGWRWSFYLSAIIFGLSGTGFALLYRPPPLPYSDGLTTRQRIAKLDFPGYLFLALALVPFVVGLNFAQNPYPWKSAQVLAPLLIGVVFAVVLVVYSIYFRRDGLLNAELFSHGPNFALALTTIFIEGLFFYAVNQYYPYMNTVLYETDTFKVMCRYAVFFAANFAFIFPVAIFTQKTKRHREPLIFSFLVLMVFVVLLSQAKLSSSAAVYGYAVIGGVGLSALLILLMSLAQLGTPPELIALSSSLILAARSMGGAIGTSIYLVVLNNKLAAMGDNIAAAVLPAGLPESSLGEFISALANQEDSLLPTIAGVTPEIIGAGVGALLATFLNAFKYVWYTVIPFCILGAIVSFFFVEPVKEMTMVIDAPVEKVEPAQHIENAKV